MAAPRRCPLQRRARITSKEASIVALLAVAEVSGRALVQAQRRRYRRPWPKRSVLNCE
jgi:hypothetical protein